ncbi:DUF386 domain-containing protein [Thermoanaerobacteraceae bacterium SP2]|jgi:YhcH/YjgK/YiaL family protein|nr:hypothetical protein [Clostridiales bacterium]RKL63625.1 DUF386 domain-containing protein [Thermoanaerobacteraceae bacterium SP2]
MIVDNIKNIDFYLKINDGIAHGLKYIKDNDLTKLDVGKYEIDGEHLYLMIQNYKTKPINEGKWEAHRRYVDIQYIMQGKETVGYANVNKLRPFNEYDKTKDIVFLKGSGDFFTISEGYFAIFAPEDAHMPCIAYKEPQFVKKAVIKVLIH